MKLKLPDSVKGSSISNHRNLNILGQFLIKLSFPHFKKLQVTHSGVAFSACLIPPLRQGSIPKMPALRTLDGEYHSVLVWSFGPS